MALSVAEPLQRIAGVNALLFAATITSWICIPVNDALVSSEFVGIGHPSAITAPVLFVAVEEELY